MLKNIKSLLDSMLTVFKHLFKGAVTLEYPEKKKNVPNAFRGKPLVTGCVKCGTCIKVCPTGAIKITENEFFIDLNKCIFCGNCSYYCPNGYIFMSDEYELGKEKNQDLTLVYNIKKEEDKNV